MTYDRYFAAGLRRVKADPEGDLVWFIDAEFNERQAREQAIRDCITAVEHLHDHEAPHDAHRDALWNAIEALRALLEGEKS